MHRDQPLVHLLEPMFYEQDYDKPQAVTSEPKTHDFWFPYADTRSTMAQAKPDANGISHMTLPTPAFKTIELRFHDIPAGKSTPRRRSWR